ncbi:GMC oxidoreductase [Ramaria rubella]|nr:GMC oxidoreductase [Ramaria rubella]
MIWWSLSPVLLLATAMLHIAVASATLTTNPEAFIQSHFDYLVVGGGTAGIAVAAKLSESGEYTVGVIDSGEYLKDDPLIQVPGRFGQTLFNPRYDRMFPIAPQPGLNNRAPLTNGGNVLGGSSAINFEVWNRASKEEYDVIGEFARDGSWGWDGGFLPYFKKLDKYTPPTSEEVYPGIKQNILAEILTKVKQFIFSETSNENAAYHGKDGPIQTSHNPAYCDLTFPFVEAINAAGIPTIADPDSGEISGIWDSPSAVDRRTGTRVSSVSAYLEPNINRTNFIVLTSAQVTKIIWDGKKELVRAMGVQFVFGSKTYTAAVKREVVLSAGTIGTPQVLENSGVGNPLILKKQKVKSVVNLPGVGENLQDHLFFGVMFALKPGHHTMDEPRINPEFAAQQQEIYETNRTGVFTAVWSTLVFSPLQSILSNNTLAATLATLDAELAQRTPGNKLIAEQYKIQRRWLDEGRVTQWEALLGPLGGLTHYRPKPDTSYVTVLIPQLHPFSRGSVHIESKNPLVIPRIDFRYLDFDFDKTVLVKAGQFIREIMSKPPMVDFVDTIVEPPPEATTDEAVEDYIRNNVFAIQHPIGTSPLASRDIGGVVDNHLKVYGVKNVRVADASVIPMQLSTHPQATVYAIAAKVCRTTG